MTTAAWKSNNVDSYAGQEYSHWILSCGEDLDSSYEDCSKRSPPNSNRDRETAAHDSALSNNCPSDGFINGLDEDFYSSELTPTRENDSNNCQVVPEMEHSDDDSVCFHWLQAGGLIDPELFIQDQTVPEVDDHGDNTEIGLGEVGHEVGPALSGHHTSRLDEDVYSGRVQADVVPQQEAGFCQTEISTSEIHLEYSQTWSTHSENISTLISASDEDDQGSGRNLDSCDGFDQYVPCLNIEE